MAKVHNYYDFDDDNEVSMYQNRQEVRNDLKEFNKFNFQKQQAKVKKEVDKGRRS